MVFVSSSFFFCGSVTLYFISPSVEVCELIAAALASQAPALAFEQHPLLMWELTAMVEKNRGNVSIVVKFLEKLKMARPLGKLVPNAILYNKKEISEGSETLLADTAWQQLEEKEMRYKHRMSTQFWKWLTRRTSTRRPVVCKVIPVEYASQIYNNAAKVPIRLEVEGTGKRPVHEATVEIQKKIQEYEQPKRQESLLHQLVRRNALEAFALSSVKTIVLWKWREYDARVPSGDSSQCFSWPPVLLL